MADLESIAVGIENYQVQHGTYPAADTLDALHPLLSPEFVVTLPRLDGWTHPIQALVTAEGYLLASPGKDGVLDGCDGGAQRSFDADICIQDGRFTQWPEGTQQ